MTVNSLWVGALMVFAAHNLEETMAMANGWAVRHLPRVSWNADQWPLFAGAASALTLALGLVAWRLRHRPERSVTWLRIFLWIMLVNAIWHVGASVYSRSLAPGVVTAVVLILPLYSLMLYRLSGAKRFSSG